MPRLVIGRKQWQKTIIMTSDGPIIVTVAPSRGTFCRLAIEAPPTVAIYRDELLARDAVDHDRTAASAKAIKEKATNDGATLDSKLASQRQSKTN